MLQYKYFIYCFLFAIYPVLIKAQPPVYKLIPPQYELEHVKLNNKEGLGLINDITEDEQGYLWLSSTEGLHVFDGHHTVSYKNGSKAYPLGIDSTSNNFSSFSPDAKEFWVVNNYKSVIKINPTKRSIIDSFAYNPDTNRINSISFGRGKNAENFFIEINKKINVATLYRKSGKAAAVKLYGFNYTPTSNFYHYVSGNNHWLLYNGLVERLSLDGKMIKQYTYPNGAVLNYKAYATDNAIYFTDSKQEIIYTWNAATDKIEPFLILPGIVKHKIEAFYIDGSMIYIGSNLNFFIIDKSAKTIQNLSLQFTQLAKEQSPGSLSEALIKFFRQKDGSLLLATLSNIYRLKKKVPTITQFREQVYVENKFSTVLSFRQLAEDENKNIYASFYTAISKKENGKNIFTPFIIKDYPKSAGSGTYSLHYWHGYLLWNNVKINIRTGQYSYLFDSTFSGHCTQFLQHDSLWLFKWGTDILYCYDLKQNILNAYILGIENSQQIVAGTVGDINDIASDVNGQNLWLASHDLGLCLITKKGKFLRQYKSKELSTSDDYITSLHLAGDQIWFGCTDGLGILNTVTQKTQLYKNPFIINGQLKNRTVFSIQPDSIGNFYLGSSYGLLYFDTKNHTFYNLAEGHPLSTIEFNRASVFKSSDNRYYFGSTDGLYSFMPAQLEFYKSSNAIKPIKLYGITIFNSQQNDYNYLSENLDSLKKLILDPFDNNIEFNFSVPEFYRDVYYSYRIKGQSDVWRDYSPDNKILLYGLQPGNYILQIKAATILSDENVQYYSLPIEMKQVWYKKTWVIILFSVVAIGLLTALLLYLFNQKVQRQKDLAALRTKISSDLHDDVGTILSGLSMQSQMLSFAASDEHKESLNEISNMSRDAMEHMRDTVWAMDSRKDKYENLIDRMRAFAERNLNMKNLTHEFIINDIDTKKFINPEKRQTIYLIFKEAITNITKHCNGSHVTINFVHEKNKLLLTIRDNGNTKQQLNSDGLGLSNMKMRAEKIGGMLTAKYENGFVIELIV